ncbi:MAG TPA: hypothetical protein VGI16_01760 [Candidatus Acidoferrum sp.]
MPQAFAPLRALAVPPAVAACSQSFAMPQAFAALQAFAASLALATLQASALCSPAFPRLLAAFLTVSQPISVSRRDGPQLRLQPRFISMLGVVTSILAGRGCEGKRVRGTVRAKTGW